MQKSFNEVKTYPFFVLKLILTDRRSLFKKFWLSDLDSVPCLGNIVGILL